MCQLQLTHLNAATSGAEPQCVFWDVQVPLVVWEICVLCLCVCVHVLYVLSLFVCAIVCVCVCVCVCDVCFPQQT